jgi:hypothetical protein
MFFPAGVYSDNKFINSISKDLVDKVLVLLRILLEVEINY